MNDAAPMRSDAPTRGRRGGGARPQEAVVGIIANPVSARDIRRVVANAGNLQLADRANIVLRALAGLGACGITRVLMMPEGDGLGGMLQRNVERERAFAGDSAVWPAVSWLEMPVSGNVVDTLRAARLLREARAAAIIVLGGDGTHRATVSECGEVPIAGLSTGTNNAYPEMRESTVVGMAVGLYASGRIPPSDALAANKRLEVAIGRAGNMRREIALVDVAVLRDSFIGAGATWASDELAALYLSFAEPGAIGLSSIGGLLQPVGRRDHGGLHVEFAPAAKNGTEPQFWLQAPIAPGTLRRVGVRNWEQLASGEPVRVHQRRGTIALDGERALTFGPADAVTVTLRENAFRSIDVDACLRHAAEHGLLRECGATGITVQSARRKI